jgi:hypothetical protein
MSEIHKEKGMMRRYLVPILPERRVMITFEVEEDDSLPAPLEREEWASQVVTTRDVVLALAWLKTVEDVSRFEVGWKREAMKEVVG